jgi:flagellar hook-basal body complex protein FliE
MINAISAVGSAENLPALLEPQKTTADFSTWVARKLDEVNTQISQADMQVRQLAVGTETNVHQVMMSLEKARLSLELVVQVRNKLLEAYQNIMQMQV